MRIRTCATLSSITRHRIALFYRRLHNAFRKLRAGLTLFGENTLKGRRALPGTPARFHQRDFGREEIGAMLARIETMFGNEPDAEFASRYVPLIQRDVDVAMAHAAIRQVFVKLSAK